MEHARVAVPAVPLFRDLYLCTAGRSVCCPGHSFGPDVRLNYLIHYILSGRGIYETDEIQHHLREGQGFLIEPGRTTRYQADEKDPWTYIWIGFNGSLAPFLLDRLKLNWRSPVFSCPSAPELETIAEQLLLPASSDICLALNQQTLLLEFFRTLTDKGSVCMNDSASCSRANYHMEKALAFIRSNYSRQIHVADVADYLGISRFHLHDLFTEMVRQTPREYISGFRLGRARELLTTTQYSVARIAQLCGYSDADVFSRAFKRKYLASPSWYRQYVSDHPGENPSDSIRLQQEEDQR